MSAYINRKNRGGKVQLYVRYRDPITKQDTSCGRVQTEKEADLLIAKINVAEAENDQEKLFELIGSRTLNAEVRKGIIVKDQLSKFKMKFKDLKEEWVQHKIDYGVGGTTRKDYSDKLNSYQINFLDDYEIGAIDSDVISAFIAQLSGSNVTRNNYARLVKYVLRYAVDRGYIFKNPFQKYHSINTDIKDLSMVIWSPEQTQSYVKFIAQEAPRVLAPLTLGLSTGMRKSELLGLHYEDFDHVNRTLTVKRSVTGFSKGEFIVGKPKTETSYRIIKLDDFSYDLLMEHVQIQENWLWKNYKVFTDRSTPLIVGSGPEYFKPNRLNQNHKRLQHVYDEKTGLYLPETAWKDLRDTWATHALESGEMSILEISKRMGHADVYITMQRYQHLTNRVLGENVQHVANYQFGNLKITPAAWNKELDSGDQNQLTG